MRYAENWTRINIKDFNLEKILAWCTKNIKGQQFIEGSVIKFENSDDAAKFKSEYKE